MLMEFTRKNGEFSMAMSVCLSGAASHEHPTSGSCFLCLIWSDLRGGRYGWQGAENGENIYVLGDFVGIFRVVHVNGEVLENSGSTKNVCRVFCFFFVSLVFSYTSSLTSTSPVVPLPPLTGFLSPICRFALVLEVVLDTYEAYDIEKKCWLPPQRLGIYPWGGKREETKIATEVPRVQKDVHLQTVWFPLLCWNIGG